ncbi:MAG: hypothetical protein WBA52_07280 [Dolichospermum sp.]
MRTKEGEVLQAIAIQVSEFLFEVSENRFEVNVHGYEGDRSPLVYLMGIPSLTRAIALMQTTKVDYF